MISFYALCIEAMSVSSAAMIKTADQAPSLADLVVRTLLCIGISV